MRIYDGAGTCRCICLDFDSSKLGADRVDADVRLVTQWLYDHGASWVTDISPNGGQHVYIPFERRILFEEASAFVLALATRYRTLDASPHLSLRSGCIRVPGSPHKSGGHQSLLMSLNNAHRILRTANRTAVWEALSNDIPDESAAARARRDQALPAAVQDETQPLEGSGRISKRVLAIAVNGDTTGYKSPSEARQAVLAAAAGAGWSLTDVDRRMKQGNWPGLAQFYARYRPHSRMKALQGDWTNAVSFVAKNRAESTRDNNAHKYPTSGPNTQGGLLQGQTLGGPEAEHRHIRNWRNALGIKESSYGGRQGLVRRMILRSLGAAAHMAESRFVQFGTRSLAVATGQDHTTVASHLRELRKESGGLIEHVSEARGTQADMYMLVIPEELREAAETRSWKKGKIHALRPVFRELGLPAAYVYEALEHSPAPLPTADLVRITGLSRTAVTEALDSMAAWNMVARNPGNLNWRVVAGTSLRALAEYFGVIEDVATQVLRYRGERAIWHQWLAANVITGPVLISPVDDYPWEEFEGPPDDWTLSDMAFAQTG